jgi:hypothetical protein
MTHHRRRMAMATASVRHEMLEEAVEIIRAPWEAAA